MLARPKAIIFDWDNTLVNTWPVIHQALHATFVQMGLEPWTIEMVKERVARSMRDSFPAIFGNHWQEAAEIYQGQFRAIHLQMLEPLPEAEETLRWLAGRQIYMAVASNKKGINLRKESAHLGWNPYFSILVGADDTPRDKPAPEPVYAALAGSDIKAGSEVWFIGDSVIDVECAHHSGCIPVFFGDLPAEPMPYPHTAQAADHHSLLQLFKQFI